MTCPSDDRSREIERVAKLCRCQYGRESGRAIMCISCTGSMGEARAAAIVDRAALGNPS